MTTYAFLCIFFSIFLHILWNLLAKKYDPSSAFFMMMAVFQALLSLPWFIWNGLRPWELPWPFWRCVLLSIAGEGFYMVSLAKGYQRADMSLFYPMVRALPVTMLAIGNVFLPLGKMRPTFIALCGMILLTASCLIMTLPEKAAKADGAKKGLMPFSIWLWLLMGVIGTCTYTVMDDTAIVSLKEFGRTWGINEAMSYLFLIESGLIIIGAALVLSEPSERKIIRTQMKYLHIHALAAIGSTSSYALILLAYDHATSNALVFAFRQIGLPVSLLAGMLFLHEKATWRKIVGICGIVLGLALTLF